MAQAASGFLKLLVNPANPRVVGPALADALTGFYAAYGILGALYERARLDGEQRRCPQNAARARVEVSMLEAMTHFNLDAFTHLFSEGEVMGPYSRPSVSQSYVLRCADGKWIALHMSSPPKFWQGLAKAIEQPDLFDDARFATREARIAAPGDTDRRARRPLRAGTPRAEWCQRLEALDVPHAPMYDTDEVPDDPQAKHLQLFVDAPHPARPASAGPPCARRSASTASAPLGGEGAAAAGRPRCGAARRRIVVGTEADTKHDVAHTLAPPAPRRAVGLWIAGLASLGASAGARTSHAAEDGGAVRPRHHHRHRGAPCRRSDGRPARTVRC